MVFFSYPGLEKAIKEYVAHYHAERPHQGVGNLKLERGARFGSGPVECHERLGGVLKSYQHAAA